MISDAAVSLASVGAARLGAMGSAGPLLGTAPRIERAKLLMIMWKLRFVARHCERYRCSGVRRVWVHQLVPIESGEDECAHG